MRQFELDDISKAAAGDQSAILRVERRKEAMKLATPVWANRTAIANFYAEAKRLTTETGIPHEVDHIVPIQGRKVCGLHVEFNLQILTKAQNISKHAKFTDRENEAAPPLRP